MRALTVAIVMWAAPAWADDVTWSGSAAVGAGAAGAAPVSAMEVRGDVAWAGGAIGLGARLRLVGDEVATQDWDEAADYLSVLRYLVLRDADDRAAARLDGAPQGWRAAFAAGRLGALRIGDGAVVDGLIADAIAERPATGAHLRIGRGDASGELAIADLGHGGVVAAAGGAPAGPLRIGATAAVDPRAPIHAAATIETTPLAAIAGSVAIERARGDRRGALALDVGWEPGLGAGAAIVATGTARTDERVVVRGRAELGAGTAGWIAAPFGPLYLRLRDGDGAMTTLVDRARAGELGGVGGAVEVAIDVDDLGTAAIAARRRPGIGTELSARAALPALAGVQAAAIAAWIPEARDALLIGAEVHAELGRGMWSGLELARQYRPDETPGRFDGPQDMLYAVRPVWQVTAWFGFAHH